MIRFLGLLIALAAVFVVAEPEPTLEEELRPVVIQFTDNALIPEGLANNSYPALIAVGLLNEFLRVQIETFIIALIGADIYNANKDQLVSFIAEMTSRAEQKILAALAPKPASRSSGQSILPSKRPPVAPSLIEAKLISEDAGKYRVLVSGTTFIISVAETYILERSENGENWNQIASKLKEPVFTDADVLPGKTYFYRFISENPDGKSLPSPTAKVVIPLDLKVEEKKETKPNAQAASQSETSQSEKEKPKSEPTEVGVSAFEPETGSRFTFNRNLTVGMIGEDVRDLQRFLNSNGFIVADTGVGSPGDESDYFGNLTKQALARFQEDHRQEILVPAGLTQGSGFFGNLTRQFINSL